MSEEAIKIFYSYSRKDLDMRNTLEDHLSALREAKRIETWHDLELEAGTEWEPAILHKLDTADIILLLISRSFIASKYCYGTELKRAIARHDAGTARVIPIILRFCDWNHDHVPFSKLNVLPTHAKPITKWKDRDKAFDIVVKSIRETVDQLSAKKQTEQKQKAEEFLPCSAVDDQEEIIQAENLKKLLELTVREENDSLQALLEEFVVNLLKGRNSKNIQFISEVYKELLEVINPVSEVTKHRINIGLSHFGNYFHKNQEIQNFIDKNFLEVRSGSTFFIEEILTYIPMGYAVFQWSLRGGKEWVIDDLSLLDPRRYNFTGSRNNITGLTYKTNVEEICVPYNKGIIHIVNKPSAGLGSPYGQLNCQKAICSYIFRGIRLRQYEVKTLVELGLMSDQLRQKIEDQEFFSKNLEFNKYLENVILSDFRDSTIKEQDIQDLIEQIEIKLLKHLIQPLIEWNFGSNQDGYYGEFKRFSSN